MPESSAEVPTGLAAADAFDSLSATAPEGWRVELIEGEIQVAPPDDGEHGEIRSEVTAQVCDRRRNVGLRTYTGLGLFIPDASQAGKVVPDLVIAPDREAGEVVVHSEPSGGSYTRRADAKLSKTIELPEPLGFELDTGEF